MLYSLEAFVPWAAEDFAADWTVAGGQAFMVAAETSELLPLIQNLETEGFLVRSVTPLAVLAATGGLTGRATHIAILEERELFIIRDGTIRQWQTLKTTNCHSLRLQQLLATEELPIEKHNRMLQTAACQAAKIVRGKEEAIIELRRGELSSGTTTEALRGYRTFLALAACLLLMVTCAVFWFHAQAHADWAVRLDERQAAIFAKLFPGVRVPVGIRARLENEASRLQGTRGSDTELPERMEVLSILHRVLTALPEGMRYRILEIRIEDGRLDLVGEVRTHSDADLIASALREQGLTVAAPSTHRLQEEGVEFRITAEWHA
jgi:hypothetical protein